MPCCTTQNFYPKIWFLKSFGKLKAPKATKTSQQNEKSWDKNTIKDLEQVIPKKDHDFLPSRLSSKTIQNKLMLSSSSVICLLPSISQNWFSRKRLNAFERIVFVDTDNKFHNANFTTSSAAIFSYQTIFLFTLHSEVWSCVWIGNSCKSTFL